MMDILSSLQKHKDDIAEEDYTKMLAAKNLGKAVPNVRRNSIIKDEVHSEEEEEEPFVRPEIDAQVRERIEIQFENTEMDLNGFKRDIEDEADKRAREADDSDEEVKHREMR